MKAYIRKLKFNEFLAGEPYRSEDGERAPIARKSQHFVEPFGVEVDQREAENAKTDICSETEVLSSHILKLKSRIISKVKEPLQMSRFAGSRTPCSLPSTPPR